MLKRLLGKRARATLANLKVNFRINSFKKFFSPIEEFIENYIFVIKARANFSHFKFI
jgi:hypothetical protein